VEPSSAHPAAVSAEGDVGAPGPGFGGDIALCLSGGGYRAAAFHLGVLDLLDRAGLLERVRTLSTISGGTLVGAAWALSCARDEAFSSFFARLWATLRDCNVVRDAVASLAQGAGGRPPSLIRAAAGVYGTPGFVGDAKLGELMASAAGPDELVFSATEFHSGRAYRFQTSRRSKARVGNLPPLAIPSAVAKEIRLADIMAASSCFPGAFEPLIFPRDFGWEDRPAIEQALGERFPPVPLMDGGIYDNQGVDGAVTVYDRGDLFEQLGLFLVSDTSQRLEPLFRESPALPGPPLRIRTLGWIARAVFALALLSSLALSYELLTARWSWATAPRLLVTGLVPAVLGAATAFSLWYGRRWLRRALDHLRTTTRVTLLPFLARLDTGDAIELIARRLRSTMAMVSQVSMKRVRRLIQESLLAESSPFRPRTALNLIYDLDRERSALWSRQPGLRPSAALRDLARRAEQVPTTLWLDNEEQLRDLLACGQATTCANLLGHLYERCLPALTDPASVESRVVAALTPLWEQLQAQPYALLERP
jgi:predicted acylesterase/phospholipase RssA